jgi:pyrimidine deaminase RibD-like protein
MVDVTAHDHRRFLERAVELARQSLIEEARTSVAPSVGVVIAREGVLLGESFRGETGAGRHAEFGLIEEVGGRLDGATAYTTLEPCSRRNEPKKPCAQHLIEAGISEVFIGMYDPNPAIYREGWRMLRDAGVRLRDFPPDLRAAIELDNAAFIDQYRRSVGERGQATFDYRQNDGQFELQGGLEGRSVTTRWTQRGRGSIYAIEYRMHVAPARYAQAFDEIDDPGALDFSNYTLPVAEGEIVVFRNETSYALVKVITVLAGPDAGQDRTELRIAFEIRKR